MRVFKSLFTILHVWWLEEFPLISFCLHSPKPGRASISQILHSTFISWYDIWLCAFISQCWMSWHNGVLGVFLEANPTTTMNSNNLTIYREVTMNHLKIDLNQIYSNLPLPQQIPKCAVAALQQICTSWVSRGEVRAEVMVLTDFS